MWGDSTKLAPQYPERLDNAHVFHVEMLISAYGVLIWLKLVDEYAVDRIEDSAI